MQTQQRGRRASARKELLLRAEQTSRAPIEAVYDLLSDVRSHLEWGGTMQPKETFRLLSLEAPEGHASVGTEFSSTGADALGRFADSSVVTEASRPALFEFVTQARLTTKKGKLVAWTNVHRYAITPREPGCRISYAERIVGVGDLTGPMGVFRVPVLRAIGLRISAANVRTGLRNLSRLAEERAGAR